MPGQAIYLFNFTDPRPVFDDEVPVNRVSIGEKADHTLEEVGQDFAVTRERIRQIEAKALRKLRHPRYSRKLRDFAD